MKTQAERQQSSRERKKASGQSRQINMWISVEAHRLLKLLSLQQSITLTAALNQLLMNAFPSVEVEHAESNQDGYSTINLETNAADKPLPIKASSPVETSTATSSVTRSSKKPDQRYIQESLF